MRQPLQRPRRPPILLDLVVQRTEDTGDGALFGDCRERCLELRESAQATYGALRFPPGRRWCL